MITGFDNILNIYKEDTINKQINLEKKLISQIIKVNTQFLLIE